MSPARPVRRRASLLGFAALALLAACQATGTGPADLLGATDRPAAWRGDGPRLPAFSGADPQARGWVRVDDLLWLDRADAGPYRQGLVFDGHAHVPFDRALAPGTPAEDGFLLRTDHVSVRTNASWAQGLQVAREAQGHVERLVGEFGDALDVRLPEGPLVVVVTATRGEFEHLLREREANPVAWGAFYDHRSGHVTLSVEPAAEGALPWRADLRHEMTHQILDLSRPPERRGRTWELPWFWLWEGVAVWSESLGPDVGGLAARLGRFRRRYAWNEWTPWARLVQMGQEAFAGRQYDQVASMMRWLLDPHAPGRRARVLALMRRLQRGPVPARALPEALGTSVARAEADWRATIGR
jgi:hypothetical protein